MGRLNSDECLNHIQPDFSIFPMGINSGFSKTSFLHLIHGKYSVWKNNQKGACTVMKKLFFILLVLVLTSGVVFAGGDQNQGATGSGSTSTGDSSQGLGAQSRSGRWCRLSIFFRKGASGGQELMSLQRARSHTAAEMPLQLLENKQKEYLLGGLVCLFSRTLFPWHPLHSMKKTFVDFPQCAWLLYR